MSSTINIEKDKIMKWINDLQSGRSGIYPYRVAEQVALEFGIPIKDASNFVLMHIRNISATC